MTTSADFDYGLHSRHDFDSQSGEEYDDHDDDIIDSGNYFRHLTSFSCPYTYNRYGKKYSALRMRENCFVLGNNGFRSYDWGDDFSVSIWFTRTGNTHVTSQLVGYGAGGGLGWQIALSDQSNGKELKVRIRTDDDPSQDYWDLSIENAFPLSTWNHVVLTYEDGEGIKVYMNNHLIATKPQKSGYVIETGTIFLLGRLLDDTIQSGDLVGAIDDMRIYNYAITNREVDALYMLDRPEEPF